MTGEERIRAINAAASVFAIDFDEAVSLIDEMEPTVDALARAEAISVDAAIARIYHIPTGAFVESDWDRARREMREAIAELQDAITGAANSWRAACLAVYRRLRD